MRYWENLIGVAKIDSNGAGSRTHSRGRRPLRIQVLVSTPDVGVQVPPRAPKPRSLNGFGVFIMPFSVRFALDFVYPTVSRFFREEKSIMGHRTSIKNPRLTKRLPLEEAETVFLNHCRIKNLSPRTIQYYQEDLEYFFAHLEGIRYADEITREVFEDFLIKQVDAGKKTTSLNTRIRGLRVFFKFCAEREYMEPFPVKLMKEDDTVKEPYTDAEIARLLQKPKTNRWV